MATVTGSGTFTAEFACIPVTGVVLYEQGELDQITGSIKAQGRSRWDSAPTWETFTKWILDPLPIKWTSPQIDLGETKYFNLSIDTEAIGTVSYLVYVSETGLFAGEESETLIEEGETSVEAFYGRFIIVTTILDGDEILNQTITTDSTTKTLEIVNVNTATLAGSNTARQIPISSPVSAITDIIVSVKALTSYAVNLYVSNTATSVVGIPVVVSKSSTAPTFAVYGIDNDPRDAVVDIMIKALPRQVMSGGKLRIIA